MPRTADDLARDGFDAFARGDFSAAIDATRDALALVPDHVEALRTLGMAHYRREEYADALAIGRRLVAAAPKDVLSYTTLSLFLQKNGRIEEAEEAGAEAKRLTWKKQLKEGIDATPGLDVLDAPQSAPVMPGGLPTVSAPMMPSLPAPPAKAPPPPRPATASENGGEPRDEEDAPDGGDPRAGDAGDDARQ